MEVIGLIGRILFVLLFVLFGITAHFIQRRQMVEYARMSGAPAPGILVPLTGAMIIIGGVLVGLGIWGDLGALLIVVFLLPTAYYMHAFWKIDDPMMRALQQAQFMKNIALAGAALVMLYMFQHFGDAVELTVGDPLF